MRTIFVTGAEGFLGGHLTAFLRQRGFDVVAGVRNRARKLIHERECGKALVCDVADAINVARIVASVKPDGIVHCAGVSNPADAEADPLNACQSTVNAWTNILDAVRRSVPRARVVLTSAFDVYGAAANRAMACGVPGCDNGQNCNDGPSCGQKNTPGNEPVTENSATSPSSTFGAMKLTAESIAHTYYRNYRLNVTIARPFHIAGPNASEASFFGAAATRIANCNGGTDGGELNFSNLNDTCDVLAIGDAVNAFFKLLEEGRPNETYNICSGAVRTFGECLKQMATAAGRNVRFGAGDGHNVNPAGSRPAIFGSNDKLRSLGWTPQHDLNEALRGLVTKTPALVGV